MKNMILHIAITTLLASMSACSDEMDPVLTQRDWDGTATYFQSARPSMASRCTINRR